MKAYPVWYPSATFDVEPGVVPSGWVVTATKQRTNSSDAHYLESGGSG